MDGDAGAINKIENGEFAAAWNDLVTSFENLLGRATTDAEKLALAGIQTLKTDLASPLGQAATTAISTAISGALAGQSIAQIGAAVLPALESSVVTAAKAAGQDVENVVLNTARVMVLGQQATTTAAPPAADAGNASSASSEAVPDSSSIAS
jgi:hypothetical protein